MLVAGGEQRVWFVDQRNDVRVIETASGAASFIARLPEDARISTFTAGAGRSYAIDPIHGRLYVIAAEGRVSTVAWLTPLISAVTAMTTAADDTLWMATSSPSQLLTFDPRSGRAQLVAIEQTTDIHSIAADHGGRVWYADDAKRSVGSYDLAAGRLKELGLGQRGVVTGLAFDGRGVLWVATSSGELYGIQEGVVVSSRSVGRPIARLGLQADGAAWFLAPGPDGTLVGPVAGGKDSLFPTSVSGLVVDGSGRLWLADTAGGGFYLVLGED